jgi:hypothetical protein
VMGALTVKIAYDRYVKKIEEFSISDFCLIFMITLLLPGRVWGHHHVCTSFVYSYVFILLLQQKRTVLVVITAVLCLLTGFITKGSIGQTLTDLLRHYSYITLVMLFISRIIVSLGYYSKERSVTIKS